MKEYNKYKKWSKAKLIKEIIRLRNRGKKKIKKIKKKIKKTKKIKKIKKKEIKTETPKIKEAVPENKTQEFAEESNAPDKEKMEKLNKWFKEAKPEQLDQLMNSEEFKKAIKERRLKAIAEVKEKKPKEIKKEDKPREPLKKQEIVKDKYREDKTMKKIRQDLETVSNEPYWEKASETPLEKTLGLLSEGYQDMKKEHESKKIEKLKIKCRYLALTKEFELLAGNSMKRFEERYPFSDEIRKLIIGGASKQGFSKIKGLTDKQKTEIDKFLKERRENLRIEVNVWFKQITKKLNLSEEEISLLAQLLNNDFPFK